MGIYGFTLLEVIIAMAVFAFAIVGLATALDTSLRSALEVRERSLIRTELESRLAIRQAIPLDQDTFVLEAKDNHGIRVEEKIEPHPLTDQDGNDVPNIKQLSITATMGSESDSASILVNQP